MSPLKLKNRSYSYATAHHGGSVYLHSAYTVGWLFFRASSIFAGHAMQIKSFSFTLPLNVSPAAVAQYPFLPPAGSQIVAVFEPPLELQQDLPTFPQSGALGMQKPVVSQCKSDPGYLGPLTLS
jgi:hypothetical protein